MDYRKLGRTGPDVSPICMGCMSIGEPGNSFNPWAIGYDEAKPLIKAALDRGINFFDTANVYSKKLGSRTDALKVRNKVFTLKRSGG